MREPEHIIGHSVALARALDQVSQLASINRPVLIVGERGTGKELAAERLHFLSARWEGPLIKVNCAAISEQLLESELFGHEPGAFTGATRTHHGRFERADGGTLFLDELGTMSMGLQEKLLRVIEYGEFERLGGQTTLQVDVRVVAATNVDVKQQVKEGKFREDLLDRLSFDVVHLPPLRQRPEDIEELAQHFAVQMSAELGWELFPGFTAAAMQQLYSHSWPGNVRELKNAVERSVYRWGDALIAVDEITVDPFIAPWGHTSTTTVDLPAADQPRVIEFSREVELFKQQLLRTSLQDNNGHQGRTAQALGLSYDQLRGLMRKYQLGARRRTE